MFVIKIPIKLALALAFYSGVVLATPAFRAQADLSPQQLKAIEERRDQARKRAVDLEKDRRLRSESFRKRSEQHRQEEVKQDKEDRKHWIDLKKMREIRQKEKLTRLPSNQIDWKKRAIERRKANRDRLFRK